MAMRTTFRAPSGVNQPAIVLAALTGAAGLGLIVLNATNDGPPILMAPGVIVLIIAALIPRALMMANQWERAVVLRLGKLHADVYKRQS